MAPWSRLLRRRHVALACALAVAGAGLVASPAAVAAASPTPDAPVLVPPETGTAEGDAPRATFGIQPAATLTGREQAGFAFGVAPGSTIFDQVAIVNYSDQPLTLNVYPQDATTGTDGQFSVKAGDEPKNDVGTWMTVGEPTTEVTVPPQSTDVGAGRVILPLTIQVPPGAEPGDHAGAIIVSLSTLSENAEGQNVRLEQRVAARVYMRIDGEQRPDLAVEDVRATFHGSWLPWRPGTVDVSYTLANTGNIRMGLDQSVAVSGPFGLGARSVTGDPLNELLPRSSVQQAYTVNGVWPLVWLRTAVTATPTAPPQAEVPALPPLTGRASLLAVPFGVLGVIVVVVILLILATVRRRRVRRRSGPPATGGPPGPEGVPPSSSPGSSREPAPSSAP